MKREIKFRGKSLKNGEWLFGDLIHIDKSDVGIVTDYDHWQGCRVNPSTVGQFTGITDENGKEVYEGDIIRSDVDACNFADGASGTVTFLQVVCFDENWVAFEPFHEMRGYEWRVVGNIHDRVLEYDGVKYKAKLIPHKENEEACIHCAMHDKNCHCGFSMNVCETFSCLEDDGMVAVLERADTSAATCKDE